MSTIYTYIYMMNLNIKTNSAMDNWHECFYEPALHKKEKN